MIANGCNYSENKFIRVKMQVNSTYILYFQFPMYSSAKVVSSRINKVSTYKVKLKSKKSMPDTIELPQKPPPLGYR